MLFLIFLNISDEDELEDNLFDPHMILNHFEQGDNGDPNDHEIGRRMDGLRAHMTGYSLKKNAHPLW